MKTPKRESTMSLFDVFAEPEKADANCARWKRKNRIAQYKRTIARLTKELAAARESCDYLCAAYIEYERCARQLYEHIMRERKSAHQPAESGQQPELPPTGGQQDSNARNAENAKQATLTCTGAEQNTARKAQR